MNIDLGRKYPTPSGPADTQKDKEPKVSYPSLYLDDIEGLGDLPEGTFPLEGTARVTRRTKTTKDGKVTHTVELEIQSIETPDEEGAEDGKSGGGDDEPSESEIIDKGLKSAEAVVAVPVADKGMDKGED